MTLSLFNFTVRRPVQELDGSRKDVVVVRAFRDGAKATDLLSELRTAKAADDLPAYTKAVEDFASSDRRVDGLADLGDEWLALHRALIARADSPTAHELAELVGALAGGAPVADYVHGEPFHKLRDRVADTVLAAAAAPDAMTVDKPAAMRAMQLLGLVEWTGEHTGPDPRRAEIAAAVQGIVLLPDDAVPAPKSKRRGVSRSAVTAEAANSDERAVIPAVDALDAARKDLELAWRGHEVADDDLRIRVQPAEGTDFTSSLASVSSSLSGNTLAVLDHLSIDHGAGIVPALNSLDDAIALRNQRAPQPAAAIKQPEIEQAQAVPRYWLSVDDLFVVKRTRVEYQLGEVAHVENVMASEERRRTHTRFDEAETTTTAEAEREEVQERDTQTSDRFEVEKSLESTFASSLQVNANVELEAKPNPALTVRAALGVSASSSSSQAQRTASRSAKEVVEKAAQRVRTRVRTERQTRTLTRIKERNVHGFDNTGSTEHIVGAYRWLDKIEQYQTYNFGRHLLIELLIPEPAAFWKYLEASNATGGLGPPPSKPVDPFTLGELTPSSISPSSWEILAGRWSASDVPPPPPLYEIASNAWSATPTSDPEHPHSPFYVGGETAQLQIPAGYAAKSFVAQLLTGQWVAPPAGPTPAGDSAATVTVPAVVGPSRLTVGELGVTLPKGHARVTGAFPQQQGQTKPTEGNIAVGLRVEMSDGYALTVHVLCERTAEAYEQWQMIAYGAIMNAYEAKLAAYKEALAALTAEHGVQIQGRPPQENERIIRDEMRKLCIHAISGYGFDDYNGVGVTTPIELMPPTFTTDGAEHWRNMAYFFETSFDWRLMQWSFLPYTWADASRWPDLAGREDVDADFAGFLRAGAAGVLLPVREGTEDAVTHFLDTGRVWGPGPAPQTVRLLDAIGDVRVTRPEEGTPVDEPWRVRLPTELTVLDATEWKPPTIDYASEA